MRLFIKEILETLAIAVVAFIIINTSVQNYMVEGTSMMPNIGDNDYLLVNKLSYIEFNKLLTEDGLNLLSEDPSRADIVVFKKKTLNEKHLIKRVIGLPGDTVSIKNGKVYVNGQILEEVYGIIYDDSNLNEIMVQNGYFFVLGDNRPISQDSRSWGMVSKEQIIGKAWFRYWPISNMGLVKH
ncbi:MAG: signal peptidase I [Chloroflexota bacterium]|nr:signal peptidase I [Chloroflexota bacterium]